MLTANPSAALFRLKGLSTELGADYRIDLAEARVHAIQGAGREEIEALTSLAASRGVSTAELVRKAVSRYVARRRKE